MCLHLANCNVGLVAQAAIVPGCVIDLASNLATDFCCAIMPLLLLQLLLLLLVLVLLLLCLILMACLQAAVVFQPSNTWRWSLYHPCF